ncbi:hypothetical protein DFH06DRAFT_1338122 [Mycena polygramma]|nr:hypothetical protein DFH06DRAFT_1338122 [Mycena polygramma]
MVEHLEAPSLEALTSSRQQVPEEIIAFIRRSSCTLTLTKLVLLNCPVNELIPLLHEIPALTDLVVGTQHSYRASLEQRALFNAMALPEVCTDLTSFLFKHARDSADFAWDPLLAMANARVRPSRPHRSRCLRLVYTTKYLRERHEEILAQLETFRDQGLDAAFMDDDEFLALKGWGDFF